MALTMKNTGRGCALHGAIQTLQAIPGVVPILHSSAGCGIQHYLGAGTTSAHSGNFIPSTNVAEKQVVFGGTSRLREQIKNTVRLIEGELYVVLGGCATELVGDDIPAMAKESREQGYPVIDIACPGFRGDAYTGYQLAIQGLIRHLATSTNLSSEAKVPGLVNVFGVVPGQNAFWEGDLAEIRSLLEQVGLQANIFFGEGAGIEQWKILPRAELNVTLSSWGLPAVRSLQELYGTPYADCPYLPVGESATKEFLQSIIVALPNTKVRVEALTERGGRSWSYYLGRVADAYMKNNFQKEFALVAETAQGLGLLKCLTQDYGLIPKVWAISDAPTVEAQAVIQGEVNKLAVSVRPQIVYSGDVGEIHDLIRASAVELILGSSLEIKVSRELDIPLLQISFPLTDKIILGRTYAGYRGGLTLLEDLGNEIIANEQGGK
ncbi:MAG TPA: nitrogenase component 1 [Negativicutes bacterium]|nr:nitrogenase component 1 [Negativicutes bacterium]